MEKRGCQMVSLMDASINSVFSCQWPRKKGQVLQSGGANGSIVGKPQDIQITFLQLQLEVLLIREEVNTDQHELKESLHREMDAMSREVDDVRAGVLEMSYLTDDLRIHFYSFYPAYITAPTNIAKMKKILAVTSVF
ncbi:unnamed protein product [Lactuca saligna]|uniref:Uncharacterized protein n=1 Tax=Lactuca saligna TaxID=75948 RepID=A0AA36EK03_LACSI|nr:unnamed protein product [Lactuca saligna]